MFTQLTTRHAKINTHMDPHVRIFYQALVQRDLASSLCEFSRYIGMADNYISDRGDRPLSAQAQLNLFRRLVREHHYLLATRVAWSILFGEASR